MVRPILVSLAAVAVSAAAAPAATAAPAPGKPAPVKPAPPKKPPHAPDEPAPAPAPAPAPTPDRSAPAVDLSMKGAVTARVKGTGGRCGGTGDMRSVQIQSEDLGGGHTWRLTVLVTSDKDWARPSIVLDDYSGAKPQHFTWGKGKTRESRKDNVGGDKAGPSFRIDAHLRNMVAPREQVHLVGTIHCPG